MPDFDYDQDLAALQFVLERQLSDYWHDVDTNWGRNAGSYYTEDAVFIGPHQTYEGRDTIQRFYNWREEQGPRLAVHAFTNFRAIRTGSDTAESTCYLFLYAANGERILPSQLPVSISLCPDKYRLVDGVWKITQRKFEHWFESGVPVTNPKL